MLRPGWQLRTTFLTWQIRDLASSMANVGICAIKWYGLFFHFNVITFSHFFFCPLVTVTECCFDLQNQQLMSLNATWKKNTLEKVKENCDFYYKSCLRIPIYVPPPTQGTASHHEDPMHSFPLDIQCLLMLVVFFIEVALVIRFGL